VKKIIYIMVFLVFGLFISGCDNGDSGSDGSGPFSGGISGLSLSFVEGAPLSQFNAGESVPFQVLVKNNGEHEVLAGEVNVKLFGVSPTSWEGLITEYVPTSSELFGITKDVDVGGEEIVSLGEGSYIGTVYGSQEFSVHAKMCYPYTTTTVSTVCMDSTTIEQTGVQTCDINGEKISKGDVSSAPIQITSISEDYHSSDSIRFTIVLKNSGSGEVYSKDVSCNEFGVLDEGKIYVELEPTDVICYFSGGKSNSGIISLGDDSKTLICERIVEDTSSYIDNLNIILSYNYVDSIETKVTVIGN
jgi:hypothetical protein